MPATTRTTQWGDRPTAWRSTVLVFEVEHRRERRVREISLIKIRTFIYICSPRGWRLLLKWSFKSVRFLDPPSCVQYRWPIHPSSITPYFLPDQRHNKVWSKYKVQSRGAWFKFWNPRGLWRAIFCHFQVRSRASYWNFGLGYIEYFFIGWTVILMVNPDVIFSRR